MSNIIIINNTQTLWGSPHHGALLLSPLCHDYKTGIINQIKYAWYKKINDDWIIIKNIDFELNIFRERLVQLLIDERESVGCPAGNDPKYEEKMNKYYVRLHNYNKFIEHVYNRTFIKSICKELQCLICQRE